MDKLQSPLQLNETGERANNSNEMALFHVKMIIK